MLLWCYPKNVNLGTWAYFVKEIHHTLLGYVGFILTYMSPLMLALVLFIALPLLQGP